MHSWMRLENRCLWISSQIKSCDVKNVWNEVNLTVYKLKGYTSNGKFVILIVDKNQL